MKITKKYLKTEYHTKNKSIRNIAKSLGVTYDAIRDRIIELGIKRRGASESNSHYLQVLTKRFLKKEYILNKKSALKIAKDIGVGHSIVIRYLNRFDIATRTHKESHSIRHPHNYKGGRPHCVDCNKLIWYSFTRCKKCCRIEKWKDPIYRKAQITAIIKSLCIVPNKPEVALGKLLNKISPNEYKFVGNGEIVIDRFNPDFINVNGQKKIIEMYGDYWHNRPEVIKRDKKRIKVYKKYGYKTLVIWEKELKCLDKLIIKIRKYI